jgi:putative NADH-flavin reductase
MMKITVFGASGRIGGEVVRQAVAAGYDVTAVVRRGRDVEDRPSAVRLVEIDRFHDSQVLAETMSGRDAVLSGLGPRRLGDAGIVAPMTRVLLGSMELSGVHRILVISAAPVGPPHPEDTLVSRRVMYPLIGRVLRSHYADLREMEGELAQSGQDWTAVRPPRLVDREATGTYRSVIGANVPRGARIGRADVAGAMLAMIDDARTFRTPVGIAW